MNTHADKTQENKSQSVANAVSQKKSVTESAFQFVDNRPEAITQRRLEEMANYSPQAKQASQLQAMAVNHSAQQQQPIQKKENNTGLPDNLKSGIENLSGYSMGDVKVHYNSDKPAQLQAHAYAQRTDIHLASGQEKHLPHEAWHVVQQKQGRVRPNIQMKGKIKVNNDVVLEKEADEMGAKAIHFTSQNGNSLIKDQLKTEKAINLPHSTGVVQRRSIGFEFQASNAKFFKANDVTSGSRKQVIEQHHQFTVEKDGVDLEIVTKKLNLDESTVNVALLAIQNYIHHLESAAKDSPLNPTISMENKASLIELLPEKDGILEQLKTLEKDKKWEDAKKRYNILLSKNKGTEGKKNLSPEELASLIELLPEKDGILEQLRRIDAEKEHDEKWKDAKALHKTLTTRNKATGGVEPPSLEEMAKLVDLLPKEDGISEQLRKLDAEKEHEDKWKGAKSYYLQLLQELKTSKEKYPNYTKRIPFDDDLFLRFVGDKIQLEPQATFGASFNNLSEIISKFSGDKSTWNTSPDKSISAYANVGDEISKVDLDHITDPKVKGFVHLLISMLIMTHSSDSRKVPHAKDLTPLMPRASFREMWKEVYENHPTLVKNDVIYWLSKAGFNPNDLFWPKYQVAFNMPQWRRPYADYTIEKFVNDFVEGRKTLIEKEPGSHESLGALDKENPKAFDKFGMQNPLDLGNFEKGVLIEHRALGSIHGQDVLHFGQKIMDILLHPSAHAEERHHPGPETEVQQNPFTNLTVIDLSSSHDISPDQLQPLVTAIVEGNLPNLQSLILNATQISRMQREAILTSHPRPKLRLKDDHSLNF